MNVGYSDFMELCRVEDTEEWLAWLSVRGDGVYVKVPPNGMPHKERAVLSEHPTGNLNEPALRFPCTLPQLQAFLEQYGGYGSIDAFDMADWVLASEAKQPCPNPPTVSGETFTDPQGVVVTLPHMTKALEAVFKIMRDNWTDADPMRLPKQVNIAHEIDTAIGWKPQKDGKPSRNAETIARLIRPDTPSADE